MIGLCMGWMDSAMPMPSDEEIAKELFPNKSLSQEHPLDPYKEKIQEWHENKTYCSQAF